MDTIWLKEVGGGRSAFFPNLRNERFNFTSDVGIFITSLAVEGSSRPRDPNLQPSQPGGSSSGGGSSSRVLSISSNTPPMFKKSTGSSSCVTVKVVYSTMKKIGNKFSFKKLHQAFVKVVESTANVHYITHVVREKWNNNLVLVTNDGMLIEDGSGTKGELVN